MTLAPTVRPLAWTVHIHRTDETHCAESILGRYAAWVDKGVAYALVPGARERAAVGTVLGDAQRHCQDDLARRVLSALDLGEG